MDTQKITEAPEMREVQESLLGDEEWRPIKGYNNHYEVSNYGRVRGLEGLIGWKCKIGYMIASLHGERKDLLKKKVGRRRFKYEIKHYIHQLVMEAFVGPRPDGLEINHKDGNRTNNRLDNLEYVTHSENMKHAYRVLGRVGKGCKPLRFSEEEQDEIVMYYKSGLLIKEVAKIVMAHPNTVTKYLKRKGLR